MHSPSPFMEEETRLRAIIHPYSEHLPWITIIIAATCSPIVYNRCRLAGGDALGGALPSHDVAIPATVAFAYRAAPDTQQDQGRAHHDVTHC